MLDRYARLTGKPMIKGVPVGHGKDNAFLPLGVHAVMQANADGTASLRLDEAASREGLPLAGQVDCGAGVLPMKRKDDRNDM